MKTRKLFTVVPTALALALAVTSATLASTPVVQISANSQPDPLTVSGASGGSNKSNCGNIAAAPSQVIQVKESLPYLRLTVAGAGQPTLLIDGPGGRFCVLADNYSGGKPEIGGYWQAGNYSLYVGNLSPGEHPYTLSISQKKNP